jgi:hypothetical protein
MDMPVESDIEMLEIDEDDVSQLEPGGARVRARLNKRPSLEWIKLLHQQIGRSGTVAQVLLAQVHVAVEPGSVHDVISFDVSESSAEAVHARVKELVSVTNVAARVKNGDDAEQRLVERAAEKSRASNFDRIVGKLKGKR